MTPSSRDPVMLIVRVPSGEAESLDGVDQAVKEKPGGSADTTADSDEKDGNAPCTDSRTN
ncbi:hypothetical protein [uncultured Microbacterium sp.]|uniref:hypothetical protein n=1 Tax=Microbacterium sp. 22296 TaxID=3453903 RepID=UPI0025DF3863|nr:hypothetical protein [uncultured Microbacterium sp.]